MSYRNPTQHIDRSLGKDVQQLQNTITSSFRAFGESYAKRQKEAAKDIEIETARRKKLTTDLEAKKLTLKKGFANLKENNNSYDFQKILGNELKVYNEYATSLINNTIDDPKEIAKRKHRMAEIEGIAGLIKTDLGVIGSYSEGMDEKMKAAGTFGGYYLGNKSQGLEYMQVLANNLEGARDVNLLWDDEKGSYDVSYTNTPQGGDPISINSRDLRAGEVGAKEIVPIIPDATENTKAALAASGLYTKVVGENGREREVLNDNYLLPKTEIIDNPDGSGGKIKVQYVDREKFKKNLMETGTAKAYIDGLDLDDREALNNGVFVNQGGQVIVPYSDNAEFNKESDRLVLDNYVDYQVKRVPEYKVLSKIKAEKTKELTRFELAKLKDREAIVSTYTGLIESGSLEEALKGANLTTERIITNTGDEEGTPTGFLLKKGDKAYRFMYNDSRTKKFRKLLEYNGVLSPSQIDEEVKKLKKKYETGPYKSEYNNTQDDLNPFVTKN